MNYLMKFFSVATSLVVINGCANVSKIVDVEIVKTVPLLQTVATAEGKTFIKGQRYRLIKLASGESGVIFTGDTHMNLVMPTRVTWGVEIDRKNGCTTGRRFYLHSQTTGSVSEASGDRGLKLWTPSVFCFDIADVE